MSAVWTVWVDGERARGAAECGCEAVGLAVYVVCGERKVRVVDVESKTLSRHEGVVLGVYSGSWQGTGLDEASCTNKMQSLRYRK